MRRARHLGEGRPPYEIAHARLLLGLAYRGEGDEDGAREELTAAKKTFERLGAVLDLQRAAELLGESATRRTFMFTDIVDSTKLVEALGEEKWQKRLFWHDRKLRELIDQAGGEVIKHTGDGYFAAFQGAAAAVEAAASFGDYDSRVERIARRAGYLLAVTTRAGTVHSARRPLALPRLRVLDSTGVRGLEAMLRASAQHP